jgi:hypothetical protein
MYILYLGRNSDSIPVATVGDRQNQQLSRLKEFFQHKMTFRYPFYKSTNIQKYLGLNFLTFLFFA